MRIGMDELPYDKKVYQKNYATLHREQKRKRDKKYRDSGSLNKEATRRAGRKYQNSPRGKLMARLRAMKQKYGITKEEYDALFEKQHKACAICGRRYEWDYSLCVDHCHSTGVVRGLLCHDCNHLLGNARDSESILIAAIEYLKKESV